MLEKDGVAFEVPCDTVFLALGVRQNYALYEQLKDIENAVVVGDAKKAINVLHATRE